MTLSRGEFVVRRRHARRLADAVERQRLERLARMAAAENWISPSPRAVTGATWTIVLTVCFVACVVAVVCLAGLVLAIMDTWPK